MILLLTEPNDAHADHIASKLRGRSADFIRFHPESFPVETQISLAYTPSGEIRCTAYHNADRLDLGHVTSAWYRRPRPPIPHAEMADQRSRALVEQECKLVIDEFWATLDCFWLPARRSQIMYAQQKALQLTIAGELGFTIPPTLITNNPSDLLQFYREHSGHIISKLASIGFFRILGSEYARYTEIVSKHDIGYVHSVRYCPMIFQAYVPKRLELRITVVGERVFAAEIHSQASNHTRHDWRHYDLYETLHQPHDLPPDLAQRCVQLVRRLGLTYGAIDLVLTPDDRYVFLEINPNGQFLWIEKVAGLPISDAICDLLIAGPTMDRTAEYAFSADAGKR